MKSKTITTVFTYGLLACAGILSFTLPSGLSVRSTQAFTGSTAPTYRIAGAVRDFKNDHPDFGVAPSAGNGHYAGNVHAMLNSHGRPEFIGTSAGSPIDDFKISNGNVVPDGPFVPMFTVVGAEMGDGIKVTASLHIGSTVVEPFGSFDKAIAGNLNDNGNPRKYVHPLICDAKTPIWIEGRSWTPTSFSTSNNESDWTEHLKYSSATDHTQVRVLRDGDSVPTTNGFGNQDSLKTLLKAFLDSGGSKVKLNANQAIWFFELWTTDTNDAAYDMQDLVVLVTLGDSTGYLETLDAAGKTDPSAAQSFGYKVASQWKDKAGNNIPPQLFNVGATDDVAGSKGPSSTGGINSSATFDQWFSDQMGTNLSARYDIVLTQNSSGIWEYLNDAFFPIDRTLLGNQNAAHNYFFTYMFALDFTQHSGEHRFVEFKGADDAWVFIDGKLAMDLGGVLANTQQYVDVDRLALTDGQPHKLQFFYAQRNASTAIFHFRTNLDMAQQTSGYVVSGAGD